jgi:hypothetical protein
MHPTRQNRPEKLADWQSRLSSQSIVVPPDRGALWSGIGADNARRLALSMNLTTLEMTPAGADLDSGTMHDELIRDFGESWIAEKRLIFKVLSVKFAESLTGRVTVFLPETLIRPRNGAPGSFAYNAKIIWDELKEADFGDPRIAMHKITSMRVCRINAGRVVSETFMSSSSHIH